MTTGKTPPVKCKEMTAIKNYCEYCTMRHDSAGWKSRTVVALLYGRLQGIVALPVLDITMSTVRTIK
jgi:hypothetical protein